MILMSENIYNLQQMILKFKSTFYTFDCSGEIEILGDKTTIKYTGKEYRNGDCIDLYLKIVSECRREIILEGKYGIGLMTIKIDPITFHGTYELTIPKDNGIIS